MLISSSFIPRPSHRPNFDHLQYAKTEAERPGPFYYVNDISVHQVDRGVPYQKNRLETLSCSFYRMHWTFEHLQSEKPTAPSSKRKTHVWNAFFCILQAIKNWMVGRCGNAWGYILRAFHCPVFDHVQYVLSKTTQWEGRGIKQYLYHNIDEFHTMYHVSSANLLDSLGVWQRANKHVSQCSWSRSLYCRQAHWEVGILPRDPQTCFKKWGPTRLFYFYLSRLHLHAISFSFAFHCIVWTQWVNAWVE